MGGFHGGFLTWDELEKAYGRKMGEKCQNSAFFGQNPRMVPVPIVQKTSVIGTTQSGTGTHWQCGTSTGTSQSGTGTTASCNPIFAYFCIVKSHICTPIV